MKQKILHLASHLCGIAALLTLQSCGVVLTNNADLPHLDRGNYLLSTLMPS